ncbi:MAG: hypothetical protein IJA34_03845 [Lachnospiraceae bacterium]|nr:hypothetical protein [Lachnospiraceae bacterium]
MKHKRVVAIILALIMMAGILPQISITALAENETVVCTNFSEFKEAMEDKEVLNVRLVGNINEVLPVDSGECGLWSAIMLSGEKILTIEGNVTFTAPVIDVEDYSKYKNYYSLIHVMSGGKLTINGTGVLTFRSSLSNGQNAVIYNDGYTTIDGGTLVGAYNVAVYGMAIWQNNGVLTINDGGFKGYNACDHNRANKALYIYGGVTRIYGGTFMAYNEYDGTGNCYGLDINGNNDVLIYGGRFFGINLPKNRCIGEFMDYMSYAWYDDINKVTGEENEELKNGYTDFYSKTLVEEISLTVDSVKEGQKASGVVSTNTSGYTIKSVDWYDRTEDTYMESTDTFVEGHEYSVNIWLNISANHMFAINSYEGITTVTGIVNGEEVTVNNAYGQDPKSVIKVVYDCGVCNDTVIEEIMVSNVEEPKAGDTPDYLASTIGTGYKIADSNYENYHINGITWYDSTEEEYGSLMYKDSVFEPGHKYTVVIKVVTESGYEFYTNKEGEVLATCSVNNNLAKFGETFSGYQWEQKVEYTFVCNKGVITEAEITNLDVPVDGDKQDMFITAKESDYYMIDSSYGYNGVYWYDSYGNTLNKDDKFVEGEIYRVEIKLVPVKIDGVPVCTFDSSLKVMANVTQASEVYAMSDIAYVYFDFTCLSKEEKVDKTGWVKEDDNWYYYNSNGLVAKGWKNINSKYYYFDSKGVMQYSKWISGKYYVKSNGVMAVSEFVDGGRYYVDENGLWVKETKWMQIDDSWYFIKSGSVQMSKWLKIGGKYYYFNGNGIMQSSKWIGSYYVKSNGVMAVSEFVDGGKYYVDENGLWVKETKWMQLGENWYYIKLGTVQISKWVKINNKYYYFDENGVMQSSKWIGNYYVKANGVMAVSEWVDNGKYYVGEDGLWVKNP